MAVSALSVLLLVRQPLQKFPAIITDGDGGPDSQHCGGKRASQWARDATRSAYSLLMGSLRCVRGARTHAFR
ncbi:hypothetical protein BD414DRAFT_485983 [Trametes punicea]|nr:hypothetical protein BD414DRAFT_485983 [Trametes punicea]